MRPICTFRKSVIALLVFFLTHSGTVVYAQETEPNDTPAQANPIGLNITITASITPAGDVDWYKVTLPQEGTLRIIGQGITNNDFYIAIFDVNGTSQMAETEVYPLGEIDSIQKTNLAAGTYYIKVRPWSNSTGTYILRNKYFPALLPNDQEPNNTYQTAQIVQINSTITGRLNYGNVNGFDTEDWFKITIPEEGTLKFKSTSPDNNDYYIKLYDIDGTSILSQSEVYPLGDVDSVMKTNLVAGTYYCRVHNYQANHGSYYLYITFKPALLPNDQEPNNTYQTARTVQLNSATTGRLNYGNVNGFDTEDWFKVTIPEEGTLSFRSTSPDNNDYYIKLYDIDGTTILSQTEVYPLGDVDSVMKRNLSAGTYYCRVHNYLANHGSYHLSNRFTPALLPNDPEPNNTVAQAKPFPMGSTITGRINYVLGGVADNADWYYIDMPDDGVLKVISTSPDNNDYYIRLVDVDGNRVLATSNVYPLGEVDSVFGTNLMAGRYYILVYPYQGNFGSYYLTSRFTPALYAGDPEPNNSALRAYPLPADTAITGRLNYYYNNTYDTDDWFKVIMPQAGGLKLTIQSPDNNDYYLRLYQPDTSTVISHVNAMYHQTKTIYGWGLQAGATYYVRVYRYQSNFGSYSLNIEYQPAPVAAFITAQQMMQVMFTNQSQFAQSYSWNFGDGTTSDQANPVHTYPGPGAYQVTLTATNPNGSVEASKWVQFRGIQKVEGNRGGQGTKVTITVYAGGITNQSIPKIRLGNTTITGSNIVFPNVGQIQALFNLANAPLGVYDVVLSNPGQPDMVLQQAYTVEAAGQPDVFVQISGRERALINRWSSYTIHFGNRGNVDAYYQLLWIAVPDSVQFTNVIFDLNLFPDPETRAYLQPATPYWPLDTLGTQPFHGRLYAIPFKVLPAGYTFDIELKVKAIQNFDIVAFTTTPWFEPSDFPKTQTYNQCVAWAMAIFLRDKLIEQLTGLIPGADCVYSGIKTFSELTLAYAEGKLRVTTLAWGTTQVMWNCLKSLGENIPVIKAMKISKIMIDITIDIVNNYNADAECQQYKVQQTQRKSVTAATSLDPNEIVGPSGIGTQRFVNDHRADYTIFFENMNTATANAVEVFVYDTLDLNRFDASTFRFGSIWVSGTTYQVINDGNSFAKEIDLRPNINCILRVIGTFNPQNGVAFWHFISLDPVTRDITEDPNAGFLPPNVNKPQGEGSVSYNVEMKKPLVNDRTYEAQATIVFDFNEPIVTNRWINRTDLIPPTSSVTQITSEGNGKYRVRWSGTDTGSGIAFYNIYYSVANGPFVLWRNHTFVTSDTLTALPGTYYRFFSQAIDKLGNTEPLKTSGEQTIGITEYESLGLSAMLTPNPANSYVDIQILSQTSMVVEVGLVRPDGKEQTRTQAYSIQPGSNTIRLRTDELPSGLYFVLIGNERGRTAVKLMVLKH